MCARTESAKDMSLLNFDKTFKGSIHSTQGSLLG